MSTLPTQGVGLVSSISFSGTRLADAFLKGLGRRELYVTIKDNCSYQPKALHKGIHALNNDVHVGLIVTAGGLVVAQEAAKPTGATLPFISLIGGTPGAFPSVGQGYFRGGVSLETFAHNPHRVAHLRGLGIPDDRICLLSNPNSFMSPTEMAGWVAAGRGPVISAGASPGTGPANSVATYGPAFASIEAANMQAVVVSADPFFKDTMEDLIDAANRWLAAGDGQRRIVYPLHDYQNTAGRCKPMRGHTLHGPDLFEAYELLGQTAAAFLSGQHTGLQVLPISAARDH